MDKINYICSQPLSHYRDVGSGGEESVKGGGTLMRVCIYLGKVCTEFGWRGQGGDCLQNGCGRFCPWEAGRGRGRHVFCLI